MREEAGFLSEFDIQEKERGIKVINDKFPSRKIVIVGNEDAVTAYLAERLERVAIEGFSIVSVLKEIPEVLDRVKFEKKLSLMRHVYGYCGLSIEREIFDIPNRLFRRRNYVVVLIDVDSFIKANPHRSKSIQRVNDHDIEKNNTWFITTCSDESVIKDNPELFSSFEIIYV